LCVLFPEKYPPLFLDLFNRQYETVHRLEVNKLRNAAKFFGHLLHSGGISWSALTAIHLTEEDTTASSRIFIKILFQDLAENLGNEPLLKKLGDETIQPFL
jgi:pre-mRNA-splicing factor CWC22